MRDRELAIERGLEASRTLVLCLSPAALGSDWVMLACPAEASRRRRKRSTVLFRDPSNAGRRLIRLLLAATCGQNHHCVLTGVRP